MGHENIHFFDFFILIDIEKKQEMNKRETFDHWFDSKTNKNYFSTCFNFVLKTDERGRTSRGSWGRNLRNVWENQSTPFLLSLSQAFNSQSWIELIESIIDAEDITLF